MTHTSWADLRRMMPRIDVETFCSELVGGRDRPGLVVDLSPEGARLERPYVGGPTPREIVLELEVPEIDEVIWARGEVCFDRLDQAPPGRGGALGLIRTTGIRLVTAAVRDLRMLRECVIETHRARAARARVDEQLIDAACYARG
ncbi:MAG: PilZ domain-containing protein [Myxococcales bacterium]|nr:PilZ domain-containing protein [Myxococcales bacterium]